MLLRLAYLTITNAFAALRLLPRGDRDKDIEILALRHQIAVFERQLGVGARVRMPRMNAVMERWVQSCRRQLLDRCLLWNERHLRHALREHERFYTGTAPIKPSPRLPRCGPSRIRSLIQGESRA